MDDSNRQIVRRLVKMAQADGEVSPEERALLLSAIQAAGASADEEELAEMLSHPGDDDDLSELDEERRASVMRALLIMSFMDGRLSFAEFSQIEKAQKDLQISEQQMEILRVEAIEAAKTLGSSAP